MRNTIHTPDLGWEQAIAKIDPWYAANLNEQQVDADWNKMTAVLDLAKPGPFKRLKARSKKLVVYLWVK